jgi:hypothetical protein
MLHNENVFLVLLYFLRTINFYKYLYIILEHCF